MATASSHELAPAATDSADVGSRTMPKKLHGRAFYESIGSPKYIIAPMVDQSEFAWRMLARTFLPASQRSSILAYSPMLHARLFADNQKYRDSHFQPTQKSNPTAPSSTDASDAASLWLDGNPSIDRPLIVQFCANDPPALLAAAQLVAPHCDAVDLNLGCPQGIARRGRYGAFLQEDVPLIQQLIGTLHESLPVPVTAKIRVLDTREATLAYARAVLAAGASILTVHGRRREQKGHLTGLADWAAIRYLRENLPPETVLFANGNVLHQGNLDECLAATGADGVMSAEGHLSDPAIFAPAPEPGEEGREYWRGRDGKGGWRVDAVTRRYMDILHRYALGVEPPSRRPLFMPGDDTAWLEAAEAEKKTETPAAAAAADSSGPSRKKRKRDSDSGVNGAKAASIHSPNLVAVQAHLFHLLRHFVSKHTDVRDALAKARAGSGDLSAHESILSTVECKVARGLLEYEATGGASAEREKRAALKLARAKARGEAAKLAEQRAADGEAEEEEEEEEEEDVDDPESSARALRECWRPWWVAQPIVRPLPKEALAIGALQLKKSKRKAGKNQSETKSAHDASSAIPEPNGKVRTDAAEDGNDAALERITTFPTSDLVSG